MTITFWTYNFPAKVLLLKHEALSELNVKLELQVRQVAPLLLFIININKNINNKYKYHVAQLLKQFTHYYNTLLPEDEVLVEVVLELETLEVVALETVLFVVELEVVLLASVVVVLLDESLEAELELLVAVEVLLEAVVLLVAERRYWLDKQELQAPFKRTKELEVH